MSYANFKDWLTGNREKRLPETAKKWAKVDEKYRRMVAHLAGFSKEDFEKPLDKLPEAKRVDLYRANMKLLDRAEAARFILAAAIAPQPRG